MDASWLARLAPEFEQSYMIELRAFLLAEKKAGKAVFPPSDEIFSALNHTPLDKVTVVILNPYGAGLSCSGTRPSDKLGRPGRAAAEQRVIC